MSQALIPEPEPAAGDPHTPGAAAASVSTAAPPRCRPGPGSTSGGFLVAEGFPAEQISHHLGADQDAVIWLDLDDPDRADLQIVIEEFGLHPLAVEDAIHDDQRPKLDRYRTCSPACTPPRSTPPPVSCPRTLRDARVVEEIHTNGWSYLQRRAFTAVGPAHPDPLRAENGH